MDCPAGNYGGREGSSACTDCEAVKVSDRGGVACRRTTETGYVVKLVLSLALAKYEFTEDKQSKFRESIATAAGAKPADVTIDALDTILTSVGRRLLSEGPSPHHYHGSRCEGGRRYYKFINDRQD